jgi:1,4-alpha-glucan branching enzyme
MASGYLSFVLHAHLPFVRHPEYDRFLEERWLFEAVTETYIPLIKMCERLADEQAKARITISISPSLLAMLEDPLLQKRYRDHLELTIELCGREEQRLHYDGHLKWLAGVYKQLFSEALEIYDRYERRLSMAFKALATAGVLELMTCTATHGVLPLLAAQPRCVEAQVKTGVDYFESVFGFRPRGMWLPECGWAPGVDDAIARNGIRYVCVESRAVDHADVAPLYGVHAPIYTPRGVATFARDQGSTKEVWSAREGFPGDPDYREFYRDIGHDLDMDYIRPYLPGDVRADTGIKYYRISGPTAHKAPYHPDTGREKAAMHAGDFLHKRIAHIEYLRSMMETPPVITAPFDAELFGHWWFEGPQWLDFVVRKTVFDQHSIELISPGDYLDRHPVHQVGQPATSTWGRNTTFETWLNAGNDWIYDHLIDCGDRMQALADKAQNGPIEKAGAKKAGAKKASAKEASADKPSALKERALAQCARELLLAQSSDWPFIISQGTSSEYASRRVRDHVARFHTLADEIDAGKINEQQLAALEAIDNIFPEVDYRLWATDQPAK